MQKTHPEACGYYDPSPRIEVRKFGIAGSSRMLFLTIDHVLNEPVKFFNAYLSTDLHSYVDVCSEGAVSR